MKKNIIVTGVLAIALGFTSLSATDFDLRSNMLQLNKELNGIQRGFITNDVQRMNVSLDTFEANSQELLAHKNKLIEKLPKDMKNRNHKATQGRDAARKIRHSLKSIREALGTKKGLAGKKSRAKAQSAYLDIVDACFQCHNVVRDKKRLAAKNK